MLQLKIKTNRNARTLKTLLLANAVVVDSKKSENSLTKERITTANVTPLPAQGKDYEGGPVRICGNVYTDFLAAEPENMIDTATITIDLSGLKAVRFKAILGGDWPVGNEEQLRKVVDVRTKGTEASFLTVIEPYETGKLVKKVTASSANEVTVELNDGRIQRILIEKLDNSDKLKVKITEEENGKVTRSEETIYK